VPKVSNCGIQKPTVKPTELIITCADANERATRIRWLTWTSTFAATTTLVANDCEPDCADGTMFPYPAEIVLDKVNVTTHGPMFGRLVLIFPDNRAGFGRTQVDELPPYLSP
jgi:hypothetical protein